jgi:hypothetical protein
MSIDILDPTHEEDAQAFTLAPRLKSLKGTTIGVLSNGKKGTAPFFDALEREFTEGLGVARIVRVIKGNYSAPAEAHLMAQAGGWDALVAGIGD